MTHVYHRPVCVVVWLDESFWNTSSEVSTPPSSSNTSRMQNPVMRSPRLLFDIYRSSVPNTANIVLTVIVETFLEVISSNGLNRSVSTNPSGIGSPSLSSTLFPRNSNSSRIASALENDNPSWRILGAACREEHSSTWRSCQNGISRGRTVARNHARARNSLI